MTREEAINEIKSWAIPSKKGREVLETLIPELRESEDEKIRKEIIEYLGLVGKGDSDYAQPMIDRWIAYLEKLKKLFESGRGLYYYDGEKTTYCGYPATEENPYDFAMSQQEKQKEPIDPFDTKLFQDGVKEGIRLEREEMKKGQKPAEWSEEYREEDLRMRFAFYTYKDEDSALYLSNVFVEETSRNKGFGTKILAAAEKVAETLGATQIRLKVKQNSPANMWYRKHGYGYMAFKDGYDWLEKTLEYMKPIKPAEWSEEDEAAYGDLIWCIEQAKKSAKDENDMGNIWFAENWVKNRLKSLRPQPHWKPSEEQMGALNYAYCELFKRKDVSHNILGPLQNLIDTLSKL